MSQGTLIIPSTPPLSGISLVADINAALAALNTSQSGATRPSGAAAYTLWLDTSTQPRLLKMFDGTDDIVIGSMNTSTNVFTPYLAGDPLVGGALSMGDTFGCTLSNNATNPTRDIDTSAGRRRSVDDTFDLVLASAITKRLDLTWAAGSGNGGLQSGQSRSANTWYHVYLIGNPTSGVIDAMFSTSITPSLPTGYTRRRRLGSILTNASSNILGFLQVGDYFWLNAPIVDLSQVPIGVWSTKALSVPSSVRTRAIVYIWFTGSEGVDLLWRPTGSGGVGYGMALRDGVELQMDSAKHVDFCSSVGAIVSISTYGWIDNRGKDY